MKNIFVALLLVFFDLQKVMALKEQYNAGRAYSNTIGGVSLGTPNNDHNAILNREHNGEQLKDLQELDDIALAEKGAASIKENNSPQDLLNSSLKAVINATEEHKIDPKNAFLKNSFRIEADPFNATGGKEAEEKSTFEKEIKRSCEEGVTFDLDIIRKLNYKPPKRVTIDTELTIYYPSYVKRVGWKNDEIATTSIYSVNHQINIKRFQEHACPGFVPVDAVTGEIYKIDCKRIKNFTVVNFPDTNRVYVVDKYGLRVHAVKLARIKYKHDTYQDEKGSHEYWNILNSDNEKIVEENNCYQIKKQCLDTGERHFDELVVKKPCWKEKITYRCTSVPEDGCKHLKNKKCILKNSVCKEKKSDICLRWERQYACLIKEKFASAGITGGDVFCMGGDCFTPTIDKNTDLNEAIAQLAVMQHMQKDMTADHQPTVFRGKPFDCSKHMLSFKDCCSAMKGWGVSLGLGVCSESAKALVKLRALKKCHYVGTWCAEKFPLISKCKRKKSSYCCFGSKLARIFHEQGRKQLGRDWGKVESPDCGPFSLEELERMDFSKMDLSEIFEDLFNKVDSAMQKALPKQMKNQMPVMQKNIDEIRENNRVNWDNAKVQKTTY